MFSIDLNDLRSVVTLLSFFSFLAIVVWVLAKRNKAGFDEAAQLPFLDDSAAGAAPRAAESNPVSGASR